MNPLDYKQAGVDYSKIDPLKVTAVIDLTRRHRRRLYGTWPDAA